MLLTTFSSISPAKAAVVLKDRDSNSSFRVKTVKARTIIENGLASTTLVWTFADSQRRWKPEVEFRYAAPPRGVVTFFAYWFKGERVVARIVEKEKASSIYSQLTQWGIDPALITLEENNTFRATIFPIGANEDVQVEMHLVQPLEATATGQRWVLPLAQKIIPSRGLSRWIPPQKANDPCYNDVQIEVETREKGSTNFEEAHFKGRKWSLDAQNLKADRDFVINFPSKKMPTPLRADLYSSRTSGKQGYFSLLLTPKEGLRNPRLNISGVRVSDVFPARLSAISKGQNVLICGRYSGTGTANVTLWDGAKKLATQIRFSGRSGSNHPATKLWAAQQIAALGSDETYRGRVIELSKRWNLPSTQTSWLAVPTSEKINFEAAKKRAEVQKLAREVAGELVLGDKNKAKLKQAELSQYYEARGNSETLKQWADRMVGYQLEGVAYNLACAHAAELFDGQPKSAKLDTLRNQITRAVEASNQWSEQSHSAGRLLTIDKLLSESKVNFVWQRQRDLIPNYVQAVLSDGEGSSQALKLKKRIEELRRFSGQKQMSFNYDFYQQIRIPLHQLAYEKVREAGRLNPDTKKIAEIEHDMQRLLMLSGRKLDESVQTTQAYFSNVQQYMANRDSVYELMGFYRQELEKDNSDEAMLEKLNSRIEEVSSRWVIQDYYPIPKSRYQTNPLDDAAIQEAKKSGDKSKLLAQLDLQRELFVRPGDPLIAVAAPINCLQVIAILPNGEIKKLIYNSFTKNWEARFDVPVHSTEGNYLIQILIVKSDGTRQKLTMNYGVDMTAPVGHAAVSAGDEHWNLSLTADDFADRVAAFMPWNTRIELRSDGGGHFIAKVDVPETFRRGKSVVRFVVTDKAHNRTDVFLDLN